MKTTTLLLIFTLGLTGCMSTAPMAMKKTSGTTRQSSPTLQSERSSVSTEEPVIKDEGFRTSVSVDLGKEGLQIPRFTDLNGSVQNAYKIKSHDYIFKFGVEGILGKKENPGKLTFGLKGKGALAFTYWPTQQGEGEPGNYFASTGSFYTAGQGLHSGDIINIKGMWWSASPEFTAHLAVSKYIELGGAAGISLYGYPLVTISDPWTSFSAPINDTKSVGHSVFLQDYFKSFKASFDWSLNILLKSTGSKNRIYFEIGNTGPAWNFGIGTESLHIMNRTQK